MPALRFGRSGILPAHYTLANGDATLKDFRASLLGGELTSSGTMTGIDGNPHSKFDAAIKGIQLAEIARGDGKASGA